MISQCFDKLNDIKSEAAVLTMLNSKSMKPAINRGWNMDLIQRLYDEFIKHYANKKAGAIKLLNHITSNSIIIERQYPVNENGQGTYWKVFNRILNKAQKR